MRIGASLVVGALALAAGCGADEPAISAADVAACEITVRVLTDYATAMDPDPQADAAYEVWDPARDDLAAVADDVTLDSLRPAVDDVVALPDTTIGGASTIPTDEWLRLSESCNGEQLP